MRIFKKFLITTSHLKRYMSDLIDSHTLKLLNLPNTSTQHSYLTFLLILILTVRLSINPIFYLAGRRHNNRT